MENAPGGGGKNKWIETDGGEWVEAPEGVRDSQDYKEYQEEVEARKREAEQAAAKPENSDDAVRSAYIQKLLEGMAYDKDGAKLLNQAGIAKLTRGADGGYYAFDARGQFMSAGDILANLYEAQGQEGTGGGDSPEMDAEFREAWGRMEMVQKMVMLEGADARNDSEYSKAWTKWIKTNEGELARELWVGMPEDARAIFRDGGAFSGGTLGRLLKEGNLDVEGEGQEEEAGDGQEAGMAAAETEQATGGVEVSQEDSERLWAEWRGMGLNGKMKLFEKGDAGDKIRDAWIDLNEVELGNDMWSAMSEVERARYREGGDLGEMAFGKLVKKGLVGAETPVGQMEGSAEGEKKTLDDARGELAEVSAKRRGVFGRKTGGEQEALYTEAREAYGKATVAELKGKMDAFRESNPEATEEQINVEFVRLWSEENQRLIETTKDRMDNGNVIRKIGKFFDRAPKWLKIGIGVSLSVSLGAVTGELGLGAAVAVSAGKAALFTRAGSRNSAINRNAGWLSSGERVARSASIERTTTMGGVENLSKDQQQTYELMAKWMTDKHTEAILKDKYDNRKRMAIAVGSAVALTVAGRLMSWAVANRSGGGGRIEERPPVYSEVPTNPLEAPVDYRPPMNIEAPVDVRPPEWSADALNITRGEGFFQTMREAGINGSRSQLVSILRDPDVQETIMGTGLGYAREGGGGFGLLFGEAAERALPRFLEAATRVAREQGIIN